MIGNYRIHNPVALNTAWANAGDGVLVSLVKANTAKDESDILAYNHMGINKAAAGAAVAIAMEKAEANQTEVRVLVLDAPITVA